VPTELWRSETLTWQVKKNIEFFIFKKMKKRMFFNDFAKLEKPRNWSKRTFFDFSDSSKSYVFHGF
jgi:hypothetical protein